MDLKETFSSPSLLRIATVIWLFSAAIIVFMLGEIDYIVHNTLYNYGLQFSTQWAEPYWSTLHVIYAFVAVSTFFSLGTLILNIASTHMRQKPKPALADQDEPITVKVPPIEPVIQKQQSQSRTDCPHCRKTFTKPLAMLDFSHGKKQLINVCPYCNQVLGNAELQEEDERQAIILQKPHAPRQKNIRRKTQVKIGS